jgi:hypothetical protein
LADPVQYREYWYNIHLLVHDPKQSETVSQRSRASEVQ